MPGEGWFGFIKGKGLVVRHNGEWWTYREYEEERIKFQNERREAGTDMAPATKPLRG